MKRSIQEALNGSTLPAEVIDAIKESFSADDAQMIGALQKRFAGQRVKWAETPGEETVVDYLFGSTPLIPGEQFEQIKQSLIARGWKEPGKTIYFRFPS